MADARSLQALGQHFGGGLYEAEVRYLLAEEWVHTTNDILCRRSKLGISFSAEGKQVLDHFIKTLASTTPPD